MTEDEWRRAMHIRPDARPDWRAWVPALIVAAFLLVIAFSIPAARAAEQNGAGWVITECFANPERNGQRGCVEHGKPWPTRGDCRTELPLVVGTANGSRLQCFQVDLRRR